MRISACICFGLILSVGVCADATAGPYISAGDVALRNDIERLADYGVIRGTTSTWPLPWGPILADLKAVEPGVLPKPILAAYRRVREHGAWETRADAVTFKASAAIAENPTRIRSFQHTPRGELELSLGVGWLGDWFNAEINVQGVDSEQDSEDARFDESMLGVIAGNWSIAASTQQRWWGPGRDGGLILSNNARPMPALVIDRVFPESFKSKWLRWVGPWDLTAIFGQMERERHVPDTRFFGLRFSFRPLTSLQFGLSRTAQWCGEGRPCDWDTFGNLIIGRDNRGGEGINPDNEPGNQLAGVDFRWAPVVFGQPIALYGEFIGEDEAGGFPSRWIGLLGGEWSGYLFNRWSTQLFAEFSGTTCQFYESSELFNCAYNHSIYRTGYRYRGRNVGHGADNDTRLVSIGAVLVDDTDSQWRALLRFGGLNRGGAPDFRNSLTPTRQDIASLDISHSRVFSFGVIDAGIGYEDIDDVATGGSFSDTRFYLQWRSAY